MVRSTLWIPLVAVAALGCATRDASAPSASGTARTPSHGPVDPASVERVAPQSAREEVLAGRSLLVCAYDDAKYPQARLEGSIPFSELQSRLPTLPDDQGIILYCA